MIPIFLIILKYGVEGRWSSGKGGDRGGGTLIGTFDGPQMKGVVSQWQRGNATRNAENVINLTDAGLAAHYVEYIEKLVAMYK